MSYFFSWVQFWIPCCTKRHGSLASSNLWHNLSLSFFLITLTLSGSTGQVFYWMPLNFALSSVILWLDMCSEFGVRVSQKWIRFSLHNRRLMISACLAANLGQLVQVMFSRFIHCKVTNFLLLGTFENYKLNIFNNYRAVFCFFFFFLWIGLGILYFKKWLSFNVKFIVKFY